MQEYGRATANSEGVFLTGVRVLLGDDSGWPSQRSGYLRERRPGR